MPRLLTRWTTAAGLRAAAVVLLALATPPLRASVREEFVVRVGGQPTPGAEVCFYAVSDDASPLDRYLQGDETRCMSADSVIDIPPGRWAYYARKGDALVAMDATLLAVRSAAGPDVFGKTPVDLRPAATLDLRAASATLRSDEWLALYVSNDHTPYLPTIVPVRRGTATALVPANVSVLPLVVRSRRVIDVGAPVSLKEGEQGVLNAPPAAKANRATVLGWVEFDERAKDPDGPWDRMPAPVASLETADGGRIGPLLALRPGFGAHDALLAFRDVPFGKTTLRIGGDVWRSDTVALEVIGSGVAIPPRGLITAPAAQLTVRWGQDLPPGPVSGADCLGAEAPQLTEKPAVFSVRVLSCPALQPGLPASGVDLAQCTTVRTEAVDQSARVSVLRSLPPGRYLVSAGRSVVPQKLAAVTLGAGERVEIMADTPGFFVYGRISQDGEPLRARLTFATGTAVSDDTGNYVAHLDGDPRALPITVSRCDSKDVLYTDFPEAPLLSSQPHDIDITSNSLQVTVLDADTRRAVPDAHLQVAALNKGEEDAGEFVGGSHRTDERGEAVVTNLPQTRRVVVCAVKDGYERGCAAPLQLGDKKAAATTVALKYKDRFHGHVAGAVRGRVFFVRADGTVAERALIGPDGSFGFRTAHGAPEYLVVVSDLPLAVVSLPATIPEPWEVAVPVAAVRNIDVSIAKQTAQPDAYLGLVVGGRYVPNQAFSFHQTLRGQDSDVYGGGPLAIPNILATGPITVILGPPPTEVPEGPDFFTIPGAAARYPKKDAPPDGHVVF